MPSAFDRAQGKKTEPQMPPRAKSIASRAPCRTVSLCTYTSIRSIWPSLRQRPFPDANPIDNRCKSWVTVQPVEGGVLRQETQRRCALLQRAIETDQGIFSIPEAGVDRGDIPCRYVSQGGQLQYAIEFGQSFCATAGKGECLTYVCKAPR